MHKKEKDKEKGKKEDRELLLKICEFYYDKGLFATVLRFSKVTVFHIVFEAAISMYSLELLFLLSKHFIINPNKLSNMLSLVIFPIIVVLPVSFLFSLLCVSFFAFRFYFYSQNYLINPSLNYDKGKNQNDSRYDFIKKNYRKDLKYFCIMGGMVYMLATIIISIIFVDKYYYQFSNIILFGIAVPLSGLFFGIVWSTSSYHRSMRLFWHGLFPCFTLEDQQKIRNDCFIYLRNNVICNVSSLVIVIGLTIFVLMNLHPELMKDEVLNNLTTNYSFVLLALLSLLVIYIKMEYTLLYTTPKSGKCAFPSLSMIFGCKKKDMKEN